jgi:hypothetical protein
MPKWRWYNKLAPNKSLRSNLPCCVARIKSLTNCQISWQEKIQIADLGADNGNNIVVDVVDVVDTVGMV